jgi:hypothetical protein
LLISEWSTTSIVICGPFGLEVALAWYVLPADEAEFFDSAAIAF